VDDDRTPRDDELFRYFVKGLFMLLLLYGTGATLVVLVGNEVLATKMLTAFGTMFSGVLGLGAGYLLGRTGTK
jgi:hypothetical protein